ncbi:dihydroorotase [Candidatus Falkowbacteria bacterium RIFCSPLOWO2_12_FULL_45_13]|uniref:Dihydroorotase n=1 Tax=Candidatus Falkowbacteria bacterium RIFCSPLOWO2_12_FULL_45_13 TaxID=1797991 RepID=A0A1F5T0V6_9BACT|nr:MAG: dihydroorotase [candidate division WOR-1 bacterium RIFCSPHIGHO2_02_FULL_45_12]OGF32101.1 MAG: dihydroorotase [Candidatus Falkowbacteria bacterium RIFCSPLOWO2_12_FULL_45_13]
MAKLLIKNGRVVDPASNLDGQRDVLIVDGKIKTIKSQVMSRGARVIEAKGMLVLPGLIDMHAHLRDPGRPDKETIASGTRAAAMGGFTTICCMANTEPPIDNAAVVKYVKNKAEIEGVVNVLPIAAVTKGLKGEALAEMGMMLKEGAVAFSDDGQPIMRADVMRRALEYARQFKVPIISHCEDKALSHGGSMNESALSTALGLPGIPALAEENMVARDIALAREFGRLHIAHVSSAKSVDLIRQAKKKKIDVTCETCPHYFSLTEEAVKGYDTNAKVNPPLKSRTDVKAIIKGLKDGTIDVIATDHAPHNIEEKELEFNSAAFGLVGLETALALVITYLVDTKELTLKKAIEKLTTSPAKILGLNKGALKIGADADLVIVDPKAGWTVDPSQFASKSKNSPFNGWKLKGKVLCTIVSGKVVVRDGKVCS